MYSFVINVKPKSYNSKKVHSYHSRLETAFRESYPEHVPIPAEIELYGLVYHFFKTDIGIDADNLSKPIWDSLKDVLFIDDKQVKMRTAGSFNLAVNDFCYT
ncbi:RusA family crossover junction endodeoxyribonuclease [Spirosoma soli]|uniref:RusA family crossover junction endodeoxyribonuclease n=1 Tax=Spirosoma soli TaxID=1770529 RepID=A0ABW5M059_9BACT